MRTRIGMLVVLVCVSWLGYVLSQRPGIGFTREWAQIYLLKGGYRSWTMRFCDGQALIDGKFQPVVITTNGYRAGYYSWPKFQHLDTRKLWITEPDSTKN